MLRRIISYARDLPLEQSTPLNAAALPHAERNADEVLGEYAANRFTGRRAQLEMHIDFSHAYRNVVSVEAAHDEAASESTEMADADTRKKVNGVDGFNAYALKRIPK